jgi:hypothetical protein
VVERVVESPRVVKKQAVPIDRVEKGHGALDDAIGSDVARQGVVVEFVLDAWVGGAQRDDGDFSRVGEHVERGELGVAA